MFHKCYTLLRNYYFYDFNNFFQFWKNIVKNRWDAQQQLDILNISSIFNHRAQYWFSSIPNDSVWSYMMEINISVCILTYLWVNGDPQGQKLVNGKPKVPFLPRKSRLSNLVPKYFAETSSMTIRYVLNWYASMCFDLIGGLW